MSIIRAVASLLEALTLWLRHRIKLESEQVERQRKQDYFLLLRRRDDALAVGDAVELAALDAMLRDRMRAEEGPLPDPEDGGGREGGLVSDGDSRLPVEATVPGVASRHGGLRVGSHGVSPLRGRL